MKEDLRLALRNNIFKKVGYNPKAREVGTDRIIEVQPVNLA